MGNLSVILTMHVTCFLRGTQLGHLQTGQNWPFLGILTSKIWFYTTLNWLKHSDGPYLTNCWRMRFSHGNAYCDIGLQYLVNSSIHEKLRKRWKLYCNSILLTIVYIQIDVGLILLCEWLQKRIITLALNLASHGTSNNSGQDLLNDDLQSEVTHNL